MGREGVQVGLRTRVRGYGAAQEVRERPVEANVDGAGPRREKQTREQIALFVRRRRRHLFLHLVGGAFLASSICCMHHGRL